MEILHTGGAAILQGNHFVEGISEWAAGVIRLKLGVQSRADCQLPIKLLSGGPFTVRSRYDPHPSGA